MHHNVYCLVTFITTIIIIWYVCVVTKIIKDLLIKILGYFCSHSICNQNVIHEQVLMCCITAYLVTVNYQMFAII